MFQKLRKKMACCLHKLVLPTMQVQKFGKINLTTIRVTFGLLDVLFTK